MYAKSWSSFSLSLSLFPSRARSFSFHSTSLPGVAPSRERSRGGGSRRSEGCARESVAAAVRASLLPPPRAPVPSLCLCCCCYCSYTHTLSLPLFYRKHRLTDRKRKEGWNTLYVREWSRAESLAHVTRAREIEGERKREKERRHCGVVILSFSRFRGVCWGLSCCCCCCCCCCGRRGRKGQGYGALVHRWLVRTAIRRGREHHLGFEVLFFFLSRVGRRKVGGDRRSMMCDYRDLEKGSREIRALQRRRR